MKTILLVEDEDVILRPLTERLSELVDDVRVIPASNGREAANILLCTDVDLVVTDLRMPVMDGFTLLAHLMRVHPSVPAIVLTAYGTAEIRSRLKVLGAADYVEKPADFKVLPELVRAKLAQRAKGHIEGITLPGLVQILNLERKSCALVVRSRGRRGRLCCLAGQLIHAQVGDVRGLQAAFEILSWTGPEIEILDPPSVAERTIDAPFHYILLEAARLNDEAKATRTSGPPSPASRGLLSLAR